MNIISIDLPWNPSKTGRRALAITALDGNTRIAQANDDRELLELAHKHADPETLILLDVPILGCQNLENTKGKRFRPVDKALAHQGIWIQPSYRSEIRGQQLKHSLESLKTRPKVYEIYPYAVYKFLAYLERKKLLPRLNLDKFDTLLEDKFRSCVPPKYKREKDWDRRQESIKFLYSLLTDSNLGLRFPNTLHHPNTCRTFSDLDRLCDDYDACLGAIVGLYWAYNNSYAIIAGDSDSGNILLLADRWLQAQLKKEVQVRSEIVS